MKILKSIDVLYNDKLEYYNILKKNVDKVISDRKQHYWHYESRIKELGSFALKFETGRFNLENIFDDTFAVTIVVRKMDEIKMCLTLIQSLFVVIEKRPRDDSFTHKESHSFEFDDLRLILQLKKDYADRYDPSILNMRFELQIKTFLQHAWSIATHDLIYKTDEVVWAKERVAYNVKALLEQAELTISSIDEISDNQLLNKQNTKVKRVNQIISYLKTIFTQESLPSNLRKLAENVNSFLINIGISLNDVKITVKKC